MSRENKWTPSASFTIPDRIGSGGGKSCRCSAMHLAEAVDGAAAGGAFAGQFCVAAEGADDPLGMVCAGAVRTPFEPQLVLGNAVPKILGLGRRLVEPEKIWAGHQRHALRPVDPGRARRSLQRFLCDDDHGMCGQRPAMAVHHADFGVRDLAAFRATPELVDGLMQIVEALRHLAER